MSLFMSPASDSIMMPIHHATPAASQRGLSLIELMVSIVIGLVLITGIIQVFITSKQTYSLQQELGRMQEDIRFTHEFLNRDIRMAGYAGCISIANTQYESLLNDSDDAVDADWNYKNPITGMNNIGASEKVDGEISPNENTDVLILRTPVGDAADVTTDTNSTQLYVKKISQEICPDNSTGGNGLCKDDVVLISDCVNKSFLFQVSGITVDSSKGVKIAHTASDTSPGNNLTEWGGDNGLGTNFSTGSQVTKYQTTIYYIGTNDANGEPALFSRIGKDGVGNQLIEGVEDMQIEYGIDSSPDDARTFQASSYKDADDVEAADEWSRVVSVRVNLLVRSKNDLLDTASDENEIPDGVAIAADKRMRHLANFTIGIRSRLK